ncbi:hypothetical protein [Burkholderia ubonensis]|uniref:hypothetical protein n=1 Tax=Burkholderia ubonensis TaxID=101571 RepID=UPI0012FC07FE|nr:hypothetical protein [Burkholderia ubonensis]
METDTHRVTVDALAQEISLAQAADEQRRRHDEDDVRGDIRAALNRHGLANSGRPSVLRHIAQMHERHEITARHVGNNMPPHEADAIEVHPDKFWLSSEDGRKIRAFLLPDAGTAVRAHENAALTGEQRAEIVRRKRGGESAKTLAEEFGKTASYIYRVVREAPDAQSVQASDPFRRTRSRRG